MNAPDRRDTAIKDAAKELLASGRPMSLSDGYVLPDGTLYRLGGGECFFCKTQHNKQFCPGCGAARERRG